MIILGLNTRVLLPKDMEGKTYFVSSPGTGVAVLGEFMGGLADYAERTTNPYLEHRGEPCGPFCAGGQDNGDSII